MHLFEHSAAGHASSSRTPAMPRISTALGFPPSSTSSSSPDTAGSASLASPATSTPRATSPDNKPSESTKHDAPPHSPVPACMAGLALQVQSAVSRNVTGPLVQVLTDAQEASALHRAQHDATRALSTEASASSSSSSSSSGSGSTASSRTAPMPGQTSAASRYVSALSSPDLVPCDAAAQSSAQALMGTSAQDSDDLATQLHSVHAADAAHTSSSPIVAPLLQQRDSGSSDGSGSGTEASLAQSDICRTPSTSTTGSSHAGSLDTAISSVPSGTEFESNYKSHVEEQSADTLRVSVAAYDPTIAPSQASPISLSSEADNALLDYSPLPHDASAGASLVEAKFATAKVRRYAALLELIDTERNYADDLATLVLVFFDNLCMMPFFNDQPARQALVMRNSQDLLRTHQKLSAKLDAILVDLGLRKSGQRHADDQKTELEKALSPQADEAVVRAAKLFNQMMPQLQSYKAFCSRHGEALALIREAEKRHADWDAFERHCADILRLTQRAHKHTSSRPPSGATTPSVWATNSPASYFIPIASSSATPSPNLASGSTSTLTAATTATAASGSNPGSAAATPATAPSVMRQNSSRLLFRDFLIKPIQRLCLYPLVLQTLQKHSSATDDSVDELALAISLMREVADQVDEAGKRRESELRADLISSRIEPNQGVTLSFLKSLGDCQLSGTLDVLHHHRLLNPLTAPLRFKYFGVFVYHSFLLMVKVRKNSTYESRHWFPLWAARLSNVEDEQNLIPNSFRLSVRDHHFELAASNAKERQLWIDMLSLAISRATFSPPGSQAAFPCSLFFGDAPDGESLEASEAPTPNASRPAEFQGYFETAKAGTVDPLMEFLAMHAAGAAQATGTNNRGQRASSSGPWMPTEILLRHASSNSRAIVDRGMVLSDAVISARIARDGGALSTLYAASGSGIGSAVGSSLGLSRLSAKDTATVKIQRRKSCAGLLENADAEDDSNNLVFTATLVQPGSRSRSSTRGQLDAVSEREGWKSSLLKKANRVRPTSIFAPNGLSVNTDGLASPVWGPGSVSTPSSPITAGRDLLVHEFGSFGITGSVPLSPTTPTSHVAGIGGAELASHSLTSSPNSGSNSAANSTVNLRAQGYAMPTRSRTSLYSMKDSLTMTFGKRVRTRSVQGGVGEADPMHEFGVGSALSSAAASPMASNVSLPHGEVVDSSSRRPSADELYRGQKARSRTNSISSVTGSIRRVFTSASLATLSHKRGQSEAVKVGGSVQSERQLAETVVEEEAAKTGGTLRRSRTMLDYSRSWFRGSATSVVERVNAQAVAPATSPTASPTASPMASPMASPGQEQGSRGVGSRGDGMRRASDTHVGTVNAQPSRARQSSKVYNKLKFLHNNKLSPMQ